MVCFADMRNLRDASCCKVEVVKGAAGRRVDGFASTEVTSMSTDSDFICSASDVASASVRTRTSFLSTPRSLKLSPVAIRFPSRLSNLASKFGSPLTCESRTALTSK